MYLFKDLNIMMSIERTVGCQSQLQVEEEEERWIMELSKKKTCVFFFLIFKLIIGKQ